MAQNHEDTVAELHETFGERVAHDIEKKEPVSEKDAESGPTPDGAEPNEYERGTLRRVGESLPASAFLIAVVELTERFTYYGAQGLFQNYISNDANGVDGPKGLGMGHQAATGLNLFFQWFCYVTPILGAIIADQYLGKYKTILVFCAFYWVGLVILWTTSLPVAMANGAGKPGYIVAIIVIGLGTGGIKSNIAPLIADQYQRRVMAVKTEKTGERVIIDPAVTYQRIYMIFYWCINLGSLSLMATPFMEKYKGFWTAYLMCFCVFNVGIATLVLRRKTYVNRPPQGSVITDAFKALGLMIASRNMDAAKPSWRAANGKDKPVPWNDHFVDELKRALRACKVFVFYPIFWVCYGQFSTNFVTQAGQMEGHGMPNDFMQNFDPISILVFTPILDKVVYPLLRKAGIELKPIMRITIGFWLGALCLAYAAIVQHLIYKAGPCYEAPGACPEGLSNGASLPNHVHIAVQTPAYVFIGLSEIFISVTGLEYAYTKAPPNMKSFVQSIYLFTNAFGSAISEALVSVAVDPKFLWMYTGVACFSFVIGFVFYFTFRHYDAEEDKMYDLDRDQPILTHNGVKQTETDE
ncbi:Peptide transporter PTR2 [Colletotrichum sp. SAR 10_70]|nr:Peptide transporter PTR2 [Colletotrichum siamense]KAI8165662.1 Peptide transporter PTR2 [Colletotrichum sp. SAR 10_71]KAI8179437.1 Peptide transporter PTR2 [Colletotrichum sp. SAR 10_75]KAI8193442.1 Peptide transporter PTR2 [Colletotrichum sp. SAR 10_70]KAI8210854.1 Peptide transporter PTR2 [Colletotrichum sp. SAR 10_76]KAI8231507.1 Peptide transporter PTR2 [Colletotrichum sp. SAR 10_86]KAI8250365.1 Peptide transporter PTR2 [Colletotrichum sp. SAR 10_98]KAI8256356.1 Peptide transporter PT